MKLTPQMERVVYMREVRKMSFAEIASILSCARSNAWTQYHRATKRRKLLRSENRPDSGDVITQYRDGRAARLSGTDYSGHRPYHWRAAWIEADLFLERNRGVTV